MCLTTYCSILTNCFRYDKKPTRAIPELKRIKLEESNEKSIGNKTNDALKSTVSQKSRDHTLSTCITKKDEDIQESTFKDFTFRGCLTSTKSDNIIKNDIEENSGNNVAEYSVMEVDDVKERTLADNLSDISQIVQQFTDNRQQRDVTKSLEANLEPEANDFPTFSESQITTIRDAMDEAKLVQNCSEVLKDKFRIPITRGQISSIHGNEIDDQVINFYMGLLSERGTGRNSSLSVHNMDTNFYEKLFHTGYDGVKKWTKNINIFAYNLILVPIFVKDDSTNTENKENKSKNHSENQNYNYWVIVIINMKEKTIKLYDSVGTPNVEALERLLQYLDDESSNKGNRKFNKNDWSTEHLRQNNFYDSGVFICMVAEFVCLNRPIVFKQEHREYLRKKMVLEICTGQLLR